MPKHYCPNTDHEDYLEPATRVIFVDESTEPLYRCAYCAEGFISWLLRSGHDVTVKPIN